MPGTDMACDFPECNWEPMYAAELTKHPINGDHEDRRPENQMLICLNHHARLHAQARGASVVADGGDKILAVLEFGAPLTARELSHALGWTESAVRRMCLRLEEAGHIHIDRALKTNMPHRYSLAASKLPPEGHM